MNTGPCPTTLDMFTYERHISLNLHVRKKNKNKFSCNRHITQYTMFFKLMGGGVVQTAGRCFWQKLTLAASWLVGAINGLIHERSHESEDLLTSMYSSRPRVVIVFNLHQFEVWHFLPYMISRVIIPKNRKQKQKPTLPACTALFSTFAHVGLQQASRAKQSKAD